MELHEFAQVQKWVGEPKGEPYATVKSGDSFWRDEGQWVDFYQSVDHERDWYDKVVTDKTTGQVIREVHEPLSQHIGRGDSRPDRRK